DPPGWKEAFLPPRSAHGIVIQVAQQDGARDTPAPRDLPEPGPPARFDLIEHHVSDLDGATRLFREALDGQLASGTEDAAELTWPGGSRLRLVRQDGLARGGALHHIRFTRTEGSFGAGERGPAAPLAKGVGGAGGRS